MVEGDAVGKHVLYVKTDGDRIVVGSEPTQPTPHHETTYNFKDPHDCRLFLREIDKNPDLLTRLADKDGAKVVAKAVENLGASFKDSVPPLIKKDMALMDNVGDKFSERKNVTSAIADARKIANRMLPEADQTTSRMASRIDRQVERAMQ